MTARCGVVALVGWTNVGKSTLLNRLIGEKIAAVADVAQTTRTRVLGVWNDDTGAQWIFLDTPGFHRPRFRMNRVMVRVATETCKEADCIFHLFDASRGIGAGDREAAERLRSAGKPIVAVLNKVDQVHPKPKLFPMMISIQELYPDSEIFPISALKGSGVDRLVEKTRSCLPEGPHRMDDEIYTDQAERTLVAEFVREKVLHHTRQEMPHVTAVMVDRWEEDDTGMVHAYCRIVVERESQKGIIIGKSGDRLKRIGTEARRDIETMLGRSMYLELWVSVTPGWRDDRSALREFGLL
jgi:GTP-binding protein Era